MAFTVSLAYSFLSDFSSYFSKAFSTASLASLPAFFPTLSSSIFAAFAAQGVGAIAAAGAAIGILTTGSSSLSLPPARDLRTVLSFSSPELWW